MCLNLSSFSSTQVCHWTYSPAPSGSRKLVIASNEENSLTTNGHCCVIDPGFVNQKVYSSKSGTDRLIVTSVSQMTCFPLGTYDVQNVDYVHTLPVLRGSVHDCSHAVCTKCILPTKSSFRSPYSILFVTATLLSSCRSIQVIDRCC
ncbi:ATP-dependent RNA helicase DHX8 [Fasciolopsis buskii]|uniref:ATP-dependent RNA helicase DHX8 n=1 Tax=Fasciolopsis buskii TaxID=27845 RepID=A0A8E0VK14_9TREM|nr:ATP-dependent RNA helicase DHX8 [Fasciolopsis buski]